MLDAVYSILNRVEDKIQNAGKLASDKMKALENKLKKKAKPTYSFSNPTSFAERKLENDKKEG